GVGLNDLLGGTLTPPDATRYLLLCMLHGFARRGKPRRIRRSGFCGLERIPEPGVVEPAFGTKRTGLLPWLKPTLLPSQVVVPIVVKADDIYRRCDRAAIEPDAFPDDAKCHCRLTPELSRAAKRRRLE